MGDENVLKLTVVMDTQLHGYTRSPRLCTLKGCIVWYGNCVSHYENSLSPYFFILVPGASSLPHRSLGFLCVLSLCILSAALGHGLCFNYPHFTQEDSEAGAREASCLQSHSWKTAERGQEPRRPAQSPGFHHHTEMLPPITIRAMGAMCTRALPEQPPPLPVGKERSAGAAQDVGGHSLWS